MSEVLEAALDFKRALRSKSLGMTMDMADRWLASAGVLDAEIARLVIEIEAAMERADWSALERQWMQELSGYQQLRDQTYTEYEKYTEWANEYIGKEAHDAYFLGNLEATTLIGKSYGGIYPDFYNRLAKNELENLFSQFLKDTPLFDLLSPLGDVTFRHIIDTTFNGLLVGKPLDVIAREMSKAKNLGFERASVIARTEVLRARRESARQTYEASGVVRGYKRFANKYTACMSCLLLDGTVYNVDQEFEDHPNGACTLIPWVRTASEPEWETGREYFESLSPEEQEERMGTKYYKAWQSGVFDLDDLADLTVNPVWGAAPAVAPLWKLEGYSSYAEKLAKGYADEIESKSA